MKRIRDAHPMDEKFSVLVAGRLLGELYPLRAFGDFRYKWPLELQQLVLSQIGGSIPHGLRTPPYLTALPEVRTLLTEL